VAYGEHVFERFTERARQVVVLAQDEARSLGHGYIGTEHLLLGILREEEGLGARVLRSLGVTVEETRVRVARVVGIGDEPPLGQIPFTPHAKKALELSLREAMSLAHGFIGTEHILLGVVRSNEGVAAQVLADGGVDAERVCREVLSSLTGEVSDEEMFIERVAAGGGSTGYAQLAEAESTPVSRNEPMLLRGILIGWTLFGLASGIGLLVGWLIWG
jgi:ATP-dependent Clp protease ATP-binding subunit ClpC